MNDYVFRKRKHQVNAWWLVLAIVVCLCIVGNMEKKDFETRQRLQDTREKLSELQQTHYHLWEMDESCSDQLTNSVDGVLRIKVSK